MRTFGVCLSGSHRGTGGPVDGLGSGTDFVAARVCLTKVCQRLFHFCQAAEVIIVRHVNARDVPTVERGQLEWERLLCGQQMRAGALNQIVTTKNIVRVTHAACGRARDGETAAHLDGDLVGVAADVFMAGSRVWLL